MINCGTMVGNVKAVLFDLDETLIDRSGTLADFLVDQHRRYRSHFGDTPVEQFQRRFLELDQRGYGNKIQAYRTVLDEFSVDGLTAAELLADLRRHAWEKSRAFPGTAEVLQQLRDQGCKLGIVTNGTVHSQSVKITQTGLADLVDEIVISEQEQVRKPDPEIFIRAAERVGVDVRECVFVGDNPRADISGARQVGMRTVWCAHGFDWPADVDVEPDHTVEALTELLSVLFWGDDYLARLGGVDGVLWEPLWRISTVLRPVEQALLTCEPLRRLHFVCHGGGSALTTHHTHSRLQHTLGVFSLVAHFCPDDDLLRAAALLHDLGHAPFSHALEQLAGVDHHRWTVERILAPPVADILARHGFEPQAIVACIDGDPASILKNRNGILHADHLDSWARSAQAGGILPQPASEILARLHLKGQHLETDVETAELLVDLIVAEARFHCSAANLGPNAILAHLARQMFDTGVLAADDLPTMVDAEVERRLFETEVTREEARRLWYHPQTIGVRRLEGGDAPPDAHLVQVDHLYLAMPLVDGRDVTQVSPRAAGLLAEARRLCGTYAVYWKKCYCCG